MASSAAMSDHLPELLAVTSNPEVSQAARAVLSEVIGDASKPLRGMVSDQFGYWRLKRLSRLAEKTRTFAGADVQLAPVALRTLVPLLDAGSIEEDDDMQDRWAALLARAGMRPDAIPPSFVEILRALSPEEAQVLEDIADGRYVIEDPDRPEPPELKDGTISVQTRIPWMMDLDYPDPDSPEVVSTKCSTLAIHGCECGSPTLTAWVLRPADRARRLAARSKVLHGG
jgi:hypothetical protein